MGMAGFGSTFTKIGMIQRLARPLRKSDMPVREVVHICIERKEKKLWGCSLPEWLGGRGEYCWYLVSH